MARSLHLSIVVVIATTAGGLHAQKPVDACALLKPADVQAFAGNASLGNGKPSTDATGASTCEYRWGTGSANSGATFLSLTVAANHPGMTPAVIRQSFDMMAKSQPGTELISGIGDAAVYESGQQIQVKVQTLAKGSMLQLKLDTSNARGRKDDVIALLKTIVGRL